MHNNTIKAIAVILFLQCFLSRLLFYPNVLLEEHSENDGYTLIYPCKLTDDKIF